MTMSPLPTSIDAMERLLASGDYVADRSLSTVLFLALKMGRPILLEGEAGVGKTEIAKVLAKTLGRKLIRLQCYEGLDVSSAVYEWNYAAQMMAIRLSEAEGGVDRSQLEQNIFSERYLVRRPILDALTPDVAGPPVLLIDELDRTDEAFEAYLLEVLSDFQVTIPEFGTVKASPPTGRVKSTTRLSAAAFITGWIIQPPSASWRLSASKRRNRPKNSRQRSWPSSKRYANRICSRCQASPKRSIGQRRWLNLMRWRSTPNRSPIRLACC